MVDKSKSVYQFKITLKNIKPTVWRRIQVPDNYTFYDLHVAIQDAMGWSDYHLHEFRVMDPKYGEEIAIGIPDNEGFADEEIVPGWKKLICKYFSEKFYNTCSYYYDFGDGWKHEVKLEKILPASPGFYYPFCVDAERACPPEDCGGTPGYENFLQIINNPQHEEHQEMLDWVGGEFDPEKFNPQEVIFDNPKKRRQLAFKS